MANVIYFIRISKTIQQNIKTDNVQNIKEYKVYQVFD